MTVREASQARILVLATGGTIAGTADGRSVRGYNAGAVRGADLCAAIPGLERLACLTVEQSANIASQDMTEQIWFHLVRRIEAAFSADEADGVVITHGTDAMEETAFFLSCVLKTWKPVILTGAMRPGTAISPDGPANLYQAVKVASDRCAQGRGVMVVLNGIIHSPRRVTKADTWSLQTFRSRNGGPVGYVDEANVRFLEAVHHGLVFPLSKESDLPTVRILYAYAGMDGTEIDEAISAGVAGLVIAGMGDGNVSRSAMEALDRAVKAGLVVVRSSRTGDGYVHRNVEVNDDEYGFIASCDLNPQKSRILLQLGLIGNVMDKQALQRAFEA